MDILIILMVFAGISMGVVTGLTPGIHPNTLASILLSLSPLLLSIFSPEYVVVCIVSMAIIHTILDFIPSTFIGAPDPDTAISVLPAHRFLLDGRGYEVIFLSTLGGIGVILISVVMLPVLLFVLPVMYEYVKLYIVWLLLGIVVVMIATEGRKAHFGVMVFLLAGILGVVMLRNPFSDDNILFPIFTGMFGISSLLLSLSSGNSIPEQKLTVSDVKSRLFLMGSLKGFISGLVVGIIPGIGSAQASVLVSQVSRKSDVKEYMVTLGGINTVSSLFAILSLYIISKPRSGVSIVIQKILATLTINHVILVVGATLMAVGIGSIMAMRITRIFCSVFGRINYKNLCFIIISFLVFLAFFFTGFFGLLVLFTSTCIGMVAPLIKVKRSLLMGVLMIPILIFYLGI